MDTGLIIRIVGVGILVAVCAIILNKSGRDDQAMLVGLAGLIIVLLMIVGEIGELFDKISDVFGL